MIAVVCSLAVQSSRSLLFLVFFSSFDLRLFLMKWCGMNLFANIAGDLSLTIFYKMAYSKTTKTQIVAENKTSFSCHVTEPEILHICI